jgi:hypothetical protein
MAEVVGSKEKKVTVRLPKNKDGVGLNYVPVCINGNITQIMRGETVEVSPAVYKLLEEGGYLDN